MLLVPQRDRLESSLRTSESRAREVLEKNVLFGRLDGDPFLPHTTLTYERTLRAAQATGVQLLEPTRRTIALGNVRLTILPPPGRVNDGQNLNSVGVRIDGSFCAILPGDA